MGRSDPVLRGLPLTVAPLPTGSKLVVSELLQQHFDSKISSDASVSANKEEATLVRSIAEERIGLPDLGADLLHSIFSKLGPAPKDLAPVGAVCRQWRSVMREVTWKELCFRHVGGLLEELGYSEEKAESEVPPGGWGGFYKFAVYCPGLHFPTFHHVLQSPSIGGGYSWCEGVEGGGYSWKDGLGHVDKELKGFVKGEGAKAAVGLADSFPGDEVILSRLCSHAYTVAACHGPIVPAPPLIACRGIVKNFESSELAKATGAARYLHQGQEEAGASVGKKALGCPYCWKLVFPLKPGGDFSLPNWRYDELFAACSGGPFWDSDDEAEQVLATGFVCLAGHIVLGLAGDPTEDPFQTAMPRSGEGLRLERSEAALYFTNHLTGRVSFQEGQHFVTSLDLSDLISVENRLEKLLDRWPTEKHKDGSTRYRIFRQHPNEPQEKALHAPGLIVKVLQSILPAQLFQCVHKHILEGEPTLSDFMALLLDALKKRDDAWAKAKRVQRIERALRKEGFVPTAPPHEASVDAFIEDPNISLEEVLLEQKLGQAPSEEAYAQIRIEAEEKAETRKKGFEDGVAGADEDSDSESESEEENESQGDFDSNSESDSDPGIGIFHLSRWPFN